MLNLVTFCNAIHSAIHYTLMRYLFQRSPPSHSYIIYQSLFHFICQLCQLHISYTWYYISQQRKTRDGCLVYLLTRVAFAYSPEIFKQQQKHMHFQDTDNTFISYHLFQLAFNSFQNFVHIFRRGFFIDFFFNKTKNKKTLCSSDMP